jgi:hypothetical protein
MVADRHARRCRIQSGARGRRQTGRSSQRYRSRKAGLQALSRQAHTAENAQILRSRVRDASFTYRMDEIGACDALHYDTVVAVRDQRSLIRALALKVKRPTNSGSVLALSLGIVWARLVPTGDNRSQTPSKSPVWTEPDRLWRRLVRSTKNP